MGRDLVGIMFAFVFALLLPFAAAIDATTTASGTSGGSTGVVTSVIYAHVGGEFKFTEYANPSTGYNWVVAVDNPNIVAYNGNKEVGCQAQATTSDGITAVSVGSGCNYTYYFKAIAEGKTTVTMKYMRSWDSSSVVSYKQTTVVVTSANATAIVTPVPVADCRDYWWFDNSQKYCQQKKFCGAFMYYGLRTFGSEEECKAALTNATACSNGYVASKYCCADGVMCKKICRNGAYVEEKYDSFDCRKANATMIPVVTAVPKPTTPPTSTVDVKMQKGWNLFSVP